MFPEWVSHVARTYRTFGTTTYSCRQVILQVPEELDAEKLLYIKLHESILVTIYRKIFVFAHNHKINNRAIT